MTEPAIPPGSSLLLNPPPIRIPVLPGRSPRSLPIDPGAYRRRDDATPQDAFPKDAHGLCDADIPRNVTGHKLQRPGVLDAPDQVERRLLSRHPPHHARRFDAEVRH